MKDFCLKEINKMFNNNEIEKLLEYLFNTSNFKNLYLWLFDKCQYNGEIIDITKLSKEQFINLKEKAETIIPNIINNKKYSEFFILNNLKHSFENYENLKSEKYKETLFYISLENILIPLVIWKTKNIKEIINLYCNNKETKILIEILEKDEYLNNKIKEYEQKLKILENQK